MRSRVILFTLSLYLCFAVLGCSKKTADNTSTDNASTDNASADNAAPADTQSAGQNAMSSGSANEPQQRKERREPKAEVLKVPAGTAITVSLGSAIGSKVSKPGETFSGSVAQDVRVHDRVAIPKGATVSGTVTDAKPLGKFAGGAVLQVRLDSITLNGRDLPVQTSLRTFTAKGKGKRTAVLAGGGAALGGIIGALAGGGKGAAIGAAAGGGAGAGGAAFTGNKDIVLPAESTVSFDLSESLEVKK